MLSGPTPRERELMVEVEELRERVQQLQDLLRGSGEDGVVPPEWPLSSQQRIIVHMLICRDEVSREDLSDALRAAHGAQELVERHDEALRVQVCRARQRLKPFGVEIRTNWGFGYYIPREQREALKAGAVRIG